MTEPISAPKKAKRASKTASAAPGKTKKGAKKKATSRKKASSKKVSTSKAAPKKRTTPRRAALSIGGTDVAAGQRAQVELPVARLVTGADMAIPVIAVHGRTDGPTMWINAAIHGDEINGIEVVDQVLAQIDPKNLAGTLLAVPVVNVHGFITGDRYLPDRRDLNRSFPGSKSGSLASRVAHLFMTEIVARCSVGIDLHTASDHRVNLPHIRANLDDDQTVELANAFGGALMLHSKGKAGTLRRAASAVGATTLLFEAGEPWRFNPDAISAGTSGVLGVMRHLGMIDDGGPAPHEVLQCRDSRWVRAGKSGIAHLRVGIGDRVDAKQVLGTIDDPFGKRLSTIRARHAGLVISTTLYPLVNQGDALVHIARADAM